MFYSDVWNNVPADSTLHVKLSGTGGFGVAGSHTVDTPNGPVLKGAITFAHFPLEIPVKSGEKHKVKFDVLFAGAPTTVTMVAEVTQPDGSIFGQPSPCNAKISADDKVFTVKLFANG